MSLCDFWTKILDSGRVLRPVTRSNPSSSETSSMDKVDGDEVDSLATKISEGVFARLSASLDTNHDQIAKSVSLVCESVKVVEKRVDAAEQRISDTTDSVTQLLAKLERTEARLSEADRG